MTTSAVSPRDTITVRAGRVIKYEHWVVWNGTPWCVLEIERLKEERFLLSASDPEHGGGPPVRGNLEEVLSKSGLHQKLRDEYRRLFSIKEPSLEAIRAEGFKREDVDFCN